MSCSSYSSPPCRRAWAWALSLLCAGLLALGVDAAPSGGESGTKTFDIPAASAGESLKQFSSQSGIEVIFGTATAAHVTTNAVRGAYRPRDALSQMLAGTGLVVVANEKTGALLVTRDPKAPKPAAPPSEGSRTGAIEGRVFDARRDEYLENALVTIEGTKQQVLTDSDGQYRFTNVPAGPVRLTVFYTGLGSQTERVVVPASDTLQHDITVPARLAGTGPVVKLDEYVVASSKEMDGAAIAINEQRFSSRIVNVVSADEFGTIADGSVGEFMKFLPGIVSDYTGGDARRFSINGVPPGNVPVTIAGFDLASAAGASTARTVELDQVSINSIARIEVSQSPTPESTGSALAGSVNMVPRSAFERSRPQYNYSVQMLMKASHRDFNKTPGPLWRPERKVHPGFDFSAIVPVNKSFGFTLSGGYSLQFTPEDSSGPMTWRGVNGATSTPSASGPGNYPDTTPDKPYLTNYTLRDSAKDTERYSFGGTMDYKLGPHDRISLSLQYAYLREEFASRYLNFNINKVLPGNFGPTFTHGDTSEVTVTGSARIRPGRTYMPTFTYRHNGPVWRAEAGVGYSTSRIQYMDADKGFFSGTTARRTGVFLSFDEIYYLQPGRISVTDPAGAAVNPYALDTYALASATTRPALVNDTKRTFYGNVGRDYDVRGVPVSLKTGFDVRTTRRDARGGDTTFNFVGADGKGSTTPVGTDDRAGVVLDESYSQRTPPFGFPPIQWVSNQKYRDLYKEHPNYFTVDPNAAYRAQIDGSKVANEIISAAYLRGDVSFFDRRLKLVGGVRAEQTNIDAAGRLNDPTRNFQHDASGNVIVDGSGKPVLIVPASNALGVSQLTYIDRGLRAKKEYLRLFPSLNASYSIRDNVIARAAYYTSIGRPNFNQYAGALTLPDIEQLPSSSNRITVNNVAIKPWMAKTVKVRLEYYFEKVGQVSIGAFRRDFENFFGSTVFTPTPEFLSLYNLDPATYGPYDVSTQYNLTDTVRMTGLEFDYKQALTFLPRWARGVQVFFNATALRATGPADNFQDMIPRNGNWGISLTRPKFNLRANWNYRGIQRRGPVSAGRSIEPGTYTYRAKRLYVDIGGEYYLSRQFGFFASLRNVGNATEDTKIYGPSTPDWARFNRREAYHPLWSFGIKGSF